MKPKKSRPNTPPLPPHTDWRTTDADELAKRRLRAREEKFRITNLDPTHPVFSNFEVCSQSGMTYAVEIRDVATSQYSCTCTDFRINGLGTCKHAEAVLLQLARRQRAEFKAAQRVPSPRADIVPDPAAGRLRVERNLAKLTARFRGCFDDDGLQHGEFEAQGLVDEILASNIRSVRISQDVRPWLEASFRERDRTLSRRDYEAGVASGIHPEHVTNSPLFPY